MDRVILYEYETTSAPYSGYSDLAETSPGAWELDYTAAEGIEQLNLNILPEGESGSSTILKFKVD